LLPQALFRGVCAVQPRSWLKQILNTKSIQKNIPEVKLVAKKPAKKEAKKAAPAKKK
jgi:hypothetical protein